MYYNKNGTGPSEDFGSQFSTYEPYLKIKENNKITYWFSFYGGDGIYKLNGNIIRTKIDDPNNGVVKEKMKVIEKIRQYI